LLFLLLNYSPFKNRFILDCASSADPELSIISLTPSSLSKAFISLVVFSFCLSEYACLAADFGFVFLAA